MNVDELKGRLAEFTEQATNIRDAADSEKRDLSEKEAQDLDKIFADVEVTEGEIARRSKIEALNVKSNELQPRVVPAQPIANRSSEPHQQPPRDGLQNTVIRTPQERGRWGWNTLGDFSKAIIQASRKGSSFVDQRLIVNANPATYGSEGVGTDGGFAVPPDFRTTIMSMIMAEDSILSRTDQLTSSSNQIVFPTDETAPWDLVNGIQAYWETEGGLKQQSKPVLGQATVRLNKLAVLVPITDELAEDAPALEAYLKRKAGEKIDNKISNAIISGTGVGQPLGILNSAATVVVPKESGQAADTINFINVLNMYSRLYGPNRGRAVWLVHQTVEPQLAQMTVAVKNVAGTENVGGAPVYMPANGISGSPYSTLFGRPVLPLQTTEQLGDKGDIILADLNQYMTVLKGGGMRTDISIHLWFDYDITAFRFVMRVGGQPWWNAAVTPRDGTTTVGSFVTLAERA